MYRNQLYREVVRVSNLLFGKDLTHRSGLVKHVTRVAKGIYETLSPTYRKQRDFERSHPEAPWLVPDSIPYIESLLKPDFIGFEWGSGRSTLWFAERIHHITSVEGRKDWYDTMRRELAEHGLQQKVDLRLACVTTEYGFVPSEVERYASEIDRVSSSQFDCIVIDGHFRGQCLARCVPKLKLGGYLIIDNFELPEFDQYRPEKSRLAWKVFTNDIWETAILHVDMDAKKVLERVHEQ
jgi:predicted O-methyltransferase YrrM